MNYVSPSSNPHFPLRCFIFLSMMLGVISLQSCKENPVSQGPSVTAGVSGIVYDPSGAPLDSVRVYCLYSFNINYYTMSPRSRIEKVSNADTFGFNLYQNFPNPVQNSTYLRFSIPVPCSVHIMLTDRVNNKVVYSFAESVLEGMYQVFLVDLVDSLQLHNGPYTYEFKASGTGGQQFSGSKEMFVASDLGTPNDVTTANGMYVFDFDNAFAGDSVVVYTSDLYQPYTAMLGKNVNLLFERRGYYSFTSSTYLLPTILIHSDIILTRMDQ